MTSLRHQQYISAIRLYGVVFSTCHIIICPSVHPAVHHTKDILRHSAITKSNTFSQSNHSHIIAHHSPRNGSLLYSA